MQYGNSFSCSLVTVEINFSGRPGGGGGHASVNIKIYPASSETIDSLGTNVAKNLAPGASLNLVCASGTLWKSLLPVVVFDSSGTQLN